MSTWTLPPVALLDSKGDGKVKTVIADANAVNQALTNAGVPVENVTSHRAPQLLRYQVKLETGTDPKKVERAIGAVELALGSPVRYAGMHGGHVIIEQNRSRADEVGLRPLIEMSEALIRLGLPLGIGTDAKPITARLADMPHLLVSGTTGSGKSVWLTSQITALLLRNSPADMRLTLVDPKRVELAAFEGLPHLTEPIVTEPSHVGVVLRRLTEVMDQRFAAFELAGVKKIDEYNDQAADGEHLPRMVLVIDELADIMLADKGIIERALVRLLSLGRAAGIHLILATQRPEAKVLTGLIRSNVSARVAFAVQSHHDSKIALGYVGAEKLRGAGDGLFKAPTVGEPVRFQAPMVSAADVARVVAYWQRAAADVATKAVIKADVDHVVAATNEQSEIEAGMRAEVERWQAEAENAVNSAVSSLTPEEILGDAGFSPLVVDAFVEVTANRIAELVVQKMAAVLPSNPDNTTEGVAP